MSAYFLVIFIYSGGDAVSMVSVPQPSVQACQQAGESSKQLVKGSTKELRYICVKGA